MESFCKNSQVIQKTLSADAPEVLTLNIVGPHVLRQSYICTLFVSKPTALKMYGKTTESNKSNM